MQAQNTRPSLPPDWEDRVDKTTGCWLWLGSRTKAGYARVYVDGAYQSGHRRFYEHFVGPIAEGMHVDHLCRIKPCVNPEHLEVVTPLENSRRWVAVGSPQKRPTHCKRGHLLEGDNVRLRDLPSGKVGRECKTCDALMRQRRKDARNG